MMYLLLIAVAAILLAGIWIYNRLVNDRHTVEAAWSDIDVQLKRRHEVIPKLIEAVKAYSTYEQATLTQATELRRHSEEAQAAVSNPALASQAETRLTQSLHGLLMLAEAYPELKASTQFTGLQDEISEVERDIQFARRYYNGAVKAYNVRVESFPDNLVARSFRYRPAEYFEWTHA